MRHFRRKGSGRGEKESGEESVGRGGGVDVGSSSGLRKVLRGRIVIVDG